MREKALNYLGMMRKANAIQIGETATGAAVRSQQAKLVVLASDASENAQDRAKTFIYGRGVPLVISPFSKEEISGAVGKTGCSMLAICDIGFADAFMKALCSISNDEYSDTADLIQSELKRVKQSNTHESKRSTGKRRK